MTLATPASNSAAPGTLAFIVIFGLVVVLVFLFISMSRHIRKVNQAARRDEEATRAAANDGADGDPAPGSARGAAAASSPDRSGNQASGRRASGQP